MTLPILPATAIPLPDIPYSVPVVRYTGITLTCPGVTGNADKHKFLATFDEVQRYIPCPTCGAATDVPVEYRGTP